MEAAHITWRPLGQLFVERGLITQDELDGALVEQRETNKRLGTILVSRGLVSGPELTSVLVDQLGMELTKESGFGSGLWDEIRRRHPRGRDRVEPEQAAPEDIVEEQPPAPPEVEAPTPLVPVQEAPAGTVRIPDPVRLEADLAKERAALAAAVAEERAELEEALAEERSTLVAALDEERMARQQALEELMQTRADASSRAAELEERMTSMEAALSQEQTASRAAHDELVSARAETSSRTAELSSLSHQIDELRAQVERGAGAVAAEQEAREKTKQLEARLSGLETSLSAERTARRQALEELDHARAQVEERSAGAVAAEQAAREKTNQLAARLTALEATLADEQAAHRQAVEELDHAHSEAGSEARQLRSSVDRIRGELDQLDAATSWFEYWAGATAPASGREEQTEAE
jgi:DNA repair exonuclease SbcCD ATPase subunit